MGIGIDGNAPTTKFYDTPQTIAGVQRLKEGAKPNPGSAATGPDKTTITGSTRHSHHRKPAAPADEGEIRPAIPQAGEELQPGAYTVQGGDNLWNIGRKLGVSDADMPQWINSTQELTNQHAGEQTDKGAVVNITNANRIYTVPVIWLAPVPGQEQPEPASTPEMTEGGEANKDSGVDGQRITFDGATAMTPPPPPASDKLGGTTDEKPPLGQRWAKWVFDPSHPIRSKLLGLTVSEKYKIDMDASGGPKPEDQGIG